jgi:hypothetical protein
LLKRTRQRKNLISPAVPQVAADLLTSGEHGTCGSVAQLLHEKGHTSRVLHRTTVAKAAKAAAAESGMKLQVERGRPKQALAPANMAARLRFAAATRVGHQQHCQHSMATTPPQ